MKNERDELWLIARQLRAHVEWLHEQGETGMPRFAGAGVTSANEPRSTSSPGVVAGSVLPAVPARPAGMPLSPLAALDDAIGEPKRPAPPVPAKPAISPLPPVSPVAPIPVISSIPAKPAIPAPTASVAASVIEVVAPRTLSVIREELGECTRCRLHATRKNIVFGVGNPEADLMFVGEGPGADEDTQGEPFVGQAGKLLTRIIGAMGMNRDEVYIANVVKCRPPENRDPEVDEVAACSPFLFQQIASIKPKVLVALGRPACATLLGKPLSTSITALRGKFLQYRGEIPLMPTFHPAYLLRSPEKKREVWDDMKAVVAELEKRTGKTYVLAGGN